MRSRLAMLSVVILIGLTMLSSQSAAFKPLSGIVDSITEGTSNAGATPRGHTQDEGGDPDGIGLDVPTGPGDPGFTGGSPEPLSTEQVAGEDPFGGYYTWLLAFLVGISW